MLDLFYYTRYFIASIKGRKRLVTSKFRSIYNIDVNDLKDKGIKLMVFDVDDTIGEHRGLIPQKSLDLLNEIKSNGINVVIFSNCGSKRRNELEKVFLPLQIKVVAASNKPNPKGYLAACRLSNTNPEHSAMIGEKIGTDLYGAYLAGYKERIMVQPYTKIFGGKKSMLIVRWLRELENLTF